MGTSEPGAGPSSLTERGRRCYARREWDEAFRAFEEADRSAPLDVEDLEIYVLAAGLTARDAPMLATLERVHQTHLEQGRPVRAARSAIWLAFRLFALGEIARATGWLGRAQRLVADVDCAEHGYLLIPTARRHLVAGQPDEAAAVAIRAADIGIRFSEPDLIALARNLQGRAVVGLGRVEEGLALMDEAMVAATAGELSPLMTGLVYCNVIANCQQVYALDRAREWTAALAGWSAAQPQLVAFTGACLVHRSEILQFGGAWPDALAVAERVTQAAHGSEGSALADAYYQRAEIHRLRGAFAAAEEAYRAASLAGGQAQPGLALLRLAQGRPDAAASALRPALEGTADPLRRARFLPACVEIGLATGDPDGARRASEELSNLAAAFGSDLLDGLASQARGAVRLAEGDARAAAEPLRRAFETWRRLGVPYFAARTRVLLGRMCAALGDEEGAGLEWEAAQQAFRDLGAVPDLDAADGAEGHDHGLTRRELEVLRLLASGRTNKAIGRELFVSERTVDRHVSNLFGKLGVSSRAAATAWAYEHDVVGRG